MILIPFLLRLSNVCILHRRNDILLLEFAIHQYAIWCARKVKFYFWIKQLDRFFQCIQRVIVVLNLSFCFLFAKTLKHFPRLFRTGSKVTLVYDEEFNVAFLIMCEEVFMAFFDIVSKKVLKGKKYNYFIPFSHLVGNSILLIVKTGSRKELIAFKNDGAFHIFFPLFLNGSLTRYYHH